MTDSTTARPPSVVPMLSYENAAAAIEWLERAFGFIERREARYTGEDGSVGHAELEHDGGLIVLAGPLPHYQSPTHHAQTCEAARRWQEVPWVIDGVLVHVDDLEAHFAQAKAAGALLLSEIEDEDYGRLYRAADLEGHRWMFLQPASSGR
jgi:uncharacterized glyoxalase superfamily protein PhnB